MKGGCYGDLRCIVWAKNIAVRIVASNVDVDTVENTIESPIEHLY